MKIDNRYNPFLQLMTVYDRNVGLVDMAPIAHMKVSAQIGILLDRDGNFLESMSMNERVIIPCTADSEFRTSAPRPHLIHDNMKYLSRSGGEKHDMYMEQLEDYVRHVYDPLGYAVYRYMQKNTIDSDIGDLVSKSPLKDMTTVAFALYTRRQRIDEFNATVSR